MCVSRCTGVVKARGIQTFLLENNINVQTAILVLERGLKGMFIQGGGFASHATSPVMMNSNPASWGY